MTKKTTLLAAALAAISSVALAQDKTPKAPAPAAAAPAPAAEPAKMEAPKPPAENDMFKKMTGTWHCDATSKTPDGKEMKVKTTWAWKSVLDGHWYSVVYKRAKSGPGPAFEGNGTIGYNVAEKKYVFIGFDNMGGWINLSATDGMSYAGEGLPMGKKGPMKNAFATGKDKKGVESDKLIDVSFDLGGMPATETCKK